MSIYQNFVFYGSWRTTLEGFREKLGLNYAQTALWNLMTVATSGDAETDDPLVLGWISGSCSPNIDAARTRYNNAIENGRKGGRPKEVDPKEIESLYLSGKTYGQIADELGCSTKTVQRAIKELDNSGQNLDKDKNKEKEKEIYTERCFSEFPVDQLSQCVDNDDEVNEWIDFDGSVEEEEIIKRQIVELYDINRDMDYNEFLSEIDDFGWDMDFVKKTIAEYTEL